MTAVNYDEARYALESRLGSKGFKHSERAADTATALALVYGVDADRARLAGLLHDWNRETPADELLAEAREEELALSDADLARPHLLHARTGALAAREAFPALSDDVVQAIARHTVGAPDMTRLDMIVYLADMIEPHRDYDGVEELRSGVGVMPLEALFALAYQQSVRHIVDARKRIHPDTVAVWNTYVAGGRG